MATLFASFLCLQYSFYSTYVDSVAEHTHIQGRSSDGSFLRTEPTVGLWRNEKAESGVASEEDYEYMSLLPLRQEGAVRLGMVVRAHAG